VLGMPAGLSKAAKWLYQTLKGNGWVGEKKYAFLRSKDVLSKMAGVKCMTECGITLIGCL